jgi:hypothetical protein
LWHLSLRIAFSLILLLLTSRPPIIAVKKTYEDLKHLWTQPLDVHPSAGTSRGSANSFRDVFSLLAQVSDLVSILVSILVCLVGFGLDFGFLVFFICDVSLDRIAISFCSVPRA